MRGHPRIAYVDIYVYARDVCIHVYTPMKGALFVKMRWQSLAEDPGIPASVQGFCFAMGPIAPHSILLHVVRYG